MKANVVRVVCLFSRKLIVLQSLKKLIQKIGIFFQLFKTRETMKPATRPQPK